jgi:hypothetical protein
VRDSTCLKSATKASSSQRTLPSSHLLCESVQVVEERNVETRVDEDLLSHSDGCERYRPHCHMNTFEHCSRRSKSSWSLRDSMLITEKHMRALPSVRRIAAGVGRGAAFLGVRRRSLMGPAIASGSMVMHG